MEELNIEELNNYIKNFNFYGYASNSFFPKEQRVIRPLNVSSVDERAEVRKRIINATLPEGFIICEDEYLADCVCSFILDKKVPLEEKEIVCNFLDEKTKNMIFECYLKTELKAKFKKSPDDLSGGIFYTPKRNGVPLRFSRVNNNSLNLDSIYANYNDVVEVLTFKNKEPNPGTILAIRHLLNDSGIINQKWCPKRIKDLINNLNNEAWIEYEDSLCDKNDKLVKEDLSKASISHKVHIDKELKNSILSSVPTEFNTLEKAIYIYAKLCQLLSYNSLYFLGEKRNYDKSVSKLENMDLINNGIVCYEFSYIYADLLMELGITNIKEHKLDGEKFKDEHTNISFLIDGLVIFADSTRTVLQGDLSTLKYSSKMTGIRCELYDEDSQKAFKSAKEKVVSYIKTENETLDSNINLEGVEELSINDKIIMFNNLLVNSTLTGVNYISYVSRLISLMKLNINTKLYYSEENKNFFLQINIGSYSQNGLMSYTIDTTTKQLYRYPGDSLIFEVNVTNYQMQ